MSLVITFYHNIPNVPQDTYPTIEGTSSVTLPLYRELCVQAGWPDDRAGYQFTGWNKKADGTGTSYEQHETITGSGSFNLFGVWEIMKYTVSYNANGGSGAPATQQKTYGVNLTLSSTVPTRSGYQFQGWATSASGSVVYQPGGTYMTNAPVTLYAVWTPTYTVSYNANGGTGAPASQTKVYGIALALSSTQPTRTGYSFRGWATSASGTVEYPAGGLYTKNAAVTLYAVWLADTYIVSYNGNGGGSVPSSQIKTYGVNLKLSSQVPNRTGYTFLGWATSSTGSVAYQPGATYTTNAAVTLYAKWQILTYTVSYNANGGTNAPSSQTKTYGTNLTLSSQEPTRTGYTFQGWATSATGSVVYQPGGTYTANAAVTLYAIWKIITYTISYSANGGTGAPVSQTKTYGVNLKLSTQKPTRTGYSFQGWATSASGSVAYQPGGTYSANAAATLYAVWQILTYTVTYSANGGTGAPASQTKTYGTNLTLRTGQPTRSGYQFRCWNTKADGKGTNYQPGATYKTNAALTLYAIWDKLYYLSFHGNGGTGEPTRISAIEGATVTIPNTKPTKSSTSATYTITYNKVESGASISKSSDTVTVTTNYTFSRWNTNQNGTGTNYAAGAAYKMPAKDTILYAVYGSGQSGSTSLPTGTLTQYVLSGWSESLETIRLVGNPYVPSKNVTLYAVWSPQSNGGYIKFAADADLPVEHGSKIYLVGFHDKANDGPKTVDTYNYANGYITMTFEEDFASAGSQDASFENLRIYGTGNYVPDMDFICSLNNRLWGCSSALRTVYASALGDPTDFWTFAGNSLDAYQVAVGSSGSFTGCCAMNNNVLFFKQHVIHKVVGNFPAEYALYTYDSDGASKTNGLSAINCDGIVVYVAEHGISTYSGSTAGTLSKDLGEGNMNNAVAMFNGEKYYLHYETDSHEHKTYVFDTRYNLWVEKDYHEVLSMAHLDDHDYVLIRSNDDTAFGFYDENRETIWSTDRMENLQILDDEAETIYDNEESAEELSIIDDAGEVLYPRELFYGTIYQIDSDEDIDDEWEILFKPFYEDISGNWGSSSHLFEKKRYTGITFRLELPRGSWIKAEVKGDDGRWIPVARKMGSHNGVEDFVIRTVRLDRVQVRLSGHGPMAILGMEREFTIGSRR